MRTVEATTEDRTATGAEQDALVASAKTSSKKAGTRKKDAPKATKTANTAAQKKEGKTPRRAQAPKDAGEERVNKRAEVITLMKRGKGVTMAEIQELTGWQKHTIRGFVSLLGSKGGLKVESAKNSAGDRTYRIAK